jgi:flagellar hook protein FlgE
MLDAIYIGLSGLKAYSLGLDQISNNITNMNTSGFKASTVSFSDVFGLSGQGGLDYSSGDGSSGDGVNANQTQTDFTQGTLQQTGRDLDLSVDGTGFLVLLNGDQTSYARTGSFEVDPNGYIVLSGTQQRLAVLDDNGNPVALSVNASQTSPPEATTTVTFSDNLSSSATSFNVSNVDVYDANGGEHVWQVGFAKSTDPTADPNSWTVTVTDDTGATVGTQTLKFTNGAVDPTTAKLDFSGGADLDVTLDFSNGVTSYSAGDVSTLQSASVDGYGVGTLTSLTVDQDGHLEIGYSNSQTKDLGAVAIADFRDPDALEQRTGGMFSYNGTGQRQLLASGDPRVGRVVSGELEASNVDLSTEFGELVIIQRGFQASSQVISVSNDMIQQLFGIRGQG